MTSCEANGGKQASAVSGGAFKRRRLSNLLVCSFPQEAPKLPAPVDPRRRLAQRKAAALIWRCCVNASFPTRRLFSSPRQRSQGAVLAAVPPTPKVESAVGTSQRRRRASPRVLITKTKYRMRLGGVGTSSPSGSGGGGEAAARLTAPGTLLTRPRLIRIHHPAGWKYLPPSFLDDLSIPSSSP